MLEWDERMHARYGDTWMAVELLAAIVVGVILGLMIVGVLS